MGRFLADRHQLLPALAGRADTLNRCPRCGEPARFAYGRRWEGHEIAGWIYEKPILTCPTAPLDEFVSVKGAPVRLEVKVEVEGAELPPGAQRGRSGTLGP
jgi:hypothetical protein